MELKTIKYMKRKNLGNYEHEELTLEAVVSEGEDPKDAILFIMNEVNNALGFDVKVAPTPTAAPKEEVKKDALEDGQAIPPVIPETKVEKPKSAPRTRNAKAKAEETSKEGTPSEDTGATSSSNESTTVSKSDTGTSKENVVKDKVLDKNVVIYDASVKEHRSRFATYLAATFPNWTPDKKFGKDVSTPAKEKYAADIIVFSKGLNGKPFEDQKGIMLESFKNNITQFFSK